MADIKIKFSPRFIKVIKRIDDEFENNLSYKILGLIDGSLKYENILDIYYMDLSKVNNCFDIVVKGKKSTAGFDVLADTAVANNIQSPRRTTTEPSACFANLPVSMVMILPSPKSILS